MDLKEIHNVYFIGIGGIGMSALARYFKSIGKNVAGYDKTETPLTLQLADNGMAIHYADNLEEVALEFLNTSTHPGGIYPGSPFRSSGTELFLI